MVYLSSFAFPDWDAEYNFRLNKVKRTCYSTMYPFFVLSARAFSRVDFEPVTIFCGGNGSGKTTALNVIAEKLRLSRSGLYNRSDFFEDYVNMCPCTAECRPPHGEIITSDDVFDYMLSVRGINEGVDNRREELFEEYNNLKRERSQVRSLEDYDRLKKIADARRRTQSEFVRRNLADNVRERSNGESAFAYFTQRINRDALYLLDEPENSLSAELQQKLAAFLSDSARFYGCQFIIATHSPFILAMRGAKIYDLDADPVDIKKWTELENVRAWYKFFKEHSDKFDS